MKSQVTRQDVLTINPEASSWDLQTLISEMIGNLTGTAAVIASDLHAQGDELTHQAVSGMERQLRTLRELFSAYREAEAKRIDDAGTEVATALCETRSMMKSAGELLGQTVKHIPRAVGHE